MSLNATEIALIAQHLAQRCAGGRVRKVYGRTKDSIVLAVRAGRDNVSIVIAAHPKLCRVHTLPDRGDCPVRSPFVAALRHWLNDARILAIEAIEGDRRAQFRFEGAAGASTLEAELFGIGSNLVLVAADGRVVESLHHVRGKTRTVMPARPYDPPPVVSPRTPESRFGLSPAEVDAAVREHYEPLQAAALVDDARRRLKSIIKPRRQKAEAKARSLRQATDRLDVAQDLKRKGELLKASLHLIQPRMESVRVPDYFAPDTPQVEIKLQPALGPVANAERYFKRYRKVNTAARLALEQLPEAERDLERLADAAEQLEQADSVDAIDAIERSLFGKRVESKRKSKAPPSGPREFASADGLRVIVGRTEAENDEVTFRMASGNDYWLHVQGAPGAHVIVKASKGKSVPLETLLDAAALAKLYSVAKDADAADVDYTQRKYVRKRKGGGPGDVDYWECKTLHVRQDAARLARLFGAG